MQLISAKILDSTHLELSQPLEAPPGDIIQISVPSDGDEEMSIWRDAAKQRLSNAYADGDAIYDEL